MTCRIYRPTTERLDWQVGRSPLPLGLRSTSMPPTLLSWHLPHFISPRLARAFRDARRALWPRPAGLMAVTCCDEARSEEHTSDLQSLMRISYAVSCSNTKNYTHSNIQLPTLPYNTIF